MRKVWGAADLVSGCWPQTEQERFLLPNKHFFISPRTQEKHGRAACNDPYLTFLVTQRPLVTLLIIMAAKRKGGS